MKLAVALKLRITVRNTLEPLPNCDRSVSGPSTDWRDSRTRPRTLEPPPARSNRWRPLNVHSFACLFPPSRIPFFFTLGLIRISPCGRNFCVSCDLTGAEIFVRLNLNRFLRRSQINSSCSLLRETKQYGLRGLNRARLLVREALIRLRESSGKKKVIIRSQKLSKAYRISPLFFIMFLYETHPLRAI